MLGRCVCPPGFVDDACAVEVSCAYWDEATQTMRSEGVSRVGAVTAGSSGGVASSGATAGTVTCSTTHLTNFGGVLVIPTSAEELASEVSDLPPSPVIFIATTKRISCMPSRRRYITMIWLFTSYLSYL